MTDFGTHFPPQIYSSVYNLNVMTEGEDGIVRAVSSKESREADDETSIRECSTSSPFSNDPGIMV